MVELNKLDTASLIDLLAVHTANYLMLSQTSTSSDEFAKCFLTIRAIQREIEIRKKNNLVDTTNDNTHWMG